MPLFASIFAFYAIFWVTRAVFRTWFHPLSIYPGPLIAKLDPSWYEWYWNYYHNGQLIFQVEKLHRALGPVVRIGVNELHINDPEVYLEMTKVGSKFTKDPVLYSVISFPETSIGYTDPVGHRIRRQVITPPFSSAGVKEVVPFIQRKVNVLLERFKAASPGRSPPPIDVNAACKAFTFDIISTIVLGQDFGCVDHPLFKNEFVERLHKAFNMGWLGTAFPTLTQFSMMLPEWLSKKVFPIPILLFKDECRERIEDYQRRARGKSQDPGTVRSGVIDRLMDPSLAKDNSVLTPQQLSDEVIMLLTAGNDTTSNSMIMGIYQICRNPLVYQRLQAELQMHFPRKGLEIGLEDCKQLPYLTAVIKEVLRFTSPIPGRLPRVVPAEGFRLYDRLVPSGTVLHTSPYMLNRHSSVWPKPNVFSPDRWLQNDSINLEKYMASFNRGTRQCLGKELAWCELYLMFANLFRQLDLTIYDTSDSDMEWVDLILINFKGKNLQVKAEEKII